MGSAAAPARTAAPPGAQRGLVFDVDKFAIHDGPGIRTTVFLKGCPLRCWWCHSPESQLNRPQLLYMRGKCTGCQLCVDACAEGALRLGTKPAGELALARARPQMNQYDGCDADPSVGGGATLTAAPPVCTVDVDWERCTNCGACAEVCYPGALKIAGEWLTVEDVVQEVVKDKPFYQLSGGGVTLTGGEVTQQGAFAYEVLCACRAEGIHTAVETAGLAPWRVFARLAEVTDLFLFDLKHMDPQRHRELTGASNERVLDNLRRLAAGRRRPRLGDAAASLPGYEIVVRVPCIPGLNDGEANIHATATFARLAGLDTLHLLPYNASAPAKYEWIGKAYSLAALQTQSAEYMQHLAGICAAAGVAAQIGG